MRPFAWILVGLLGMACTDEGKSDDTDDTGTTADADLDGDSDGDDTGNDTGDDTGDPGPDLDLDDDGFDGGDAGDDCDDNDATIYPGADEVAYDGIDQDCDGADLTDVDGDGFDGGDAGDDCNDDDATVNPGAEEVAYDGIDQDCDGLDLTDVDGDGFDGGEDGDDCDDADASINPGAEEVAYDGIDNDCLDGDLTDVDGDGFDGGEAGDDCDDADAAVYPGAEEVPYDGVDNDCLDGDLTDVDGDGSDGGDAGDDCNDADDTVYPGAAEVPYDGIDQDCDGADLTDVDADGFDGGEAGDDCNDDDASVHPDADDTADLVDTDCDGLVDDDSIEPGDIVVNEVMVNPQGDMAAGYMVTDSDGEWLELYNTSDFDINVVNWTIADDDDDDMTIDADVIVPAGGYAVLGTNGDEDTNGGVTVDYVYSYGSLRLANTDDEFYMAMGETEMYSIAWYASDWPYTSGVAMGWDGEGDWADWDSWCGQSSVLESGDFGTPGADNDSCRDYTCILDDLMVDWGDIDTGDTGGAGGSTAIAGDTTFSSNDFEHSCGYTEESGPDNAYIFTAEADGCYSFSTTVSGWSPVIAGFRDCEGSEIACGTTTSSLDWSTWTYLYSSDLQIGLDEGETLTVVVDGSDMSYSDWGTYELESTVVEDVSSTPASSSDLGMTTGDAVYSGDTSLLAEEDWVGNPTCTYSVGASEAHSWTAPSTGCWFIDLSESSFDTTLSVFQGDGHCGPSETCNDDYGGLQSAVSVDAEEGEVLTILVSGYSTSTGEYVLDINACE